MAKSLAEIPGRQTASAGCVPSSPQSRRSDRTRRKRFVGSRCSPPRCCDRAASVSPHAPPARGAHFRRTSLNDYVLASSACAWATSRRVGGKNASLGEMISSLAKLGVRVPGGFATTAQAYRDFLKQGGLDERIRAALADLDVEDVTKLAATGAQIRQWMLSTPFPPALEKAVAEELQAHERRQGDRGCRALLRHSGRSAGSLFRRSAGDVPQRARRGRRAQGDARSVRVAVQRSRHRLSRASRLRSQRRRAVRRRAAHGSQRPRLERRHVHARHRLGLPRRGVHHRLLRPRRNRRAGRGESGRVLRLQAGAARRQDAPSSAATWVARPSRWSTRRRGSAERVSTVDVPQAERQRFSLNDADIVALAKQALIIEEHYKQPMDIEWGKDGSTGDIFILQARPETVQSRAGRTHSALRAQAPLEGADHRPQHRPAHRRRPGARRSRT